MTIHPTHSCIRSLFAQKIDCEWCEWFTFEEWLKVDMRQILVETHNAPMPNSRVSDVYCADSAWPGVVLTRVVQFLT